MKKDAISGRSSQHPCPDTPEGPDALYGQRRGKQGQSSRGTAEEWVPAYGFEGLYEVSDNGSVRRLVRYRNHGKTNGPWLMKACQGHAYAHVQLCKNGVKQRKYVHRLVAESFLGPCPPNKSHCAHRNGRCKDNRLVNLYWATVSENSCDRLKHGTLRWGSAVYNCSLSRQQVVEARKSNEPYASLARKWDVSAGAISLAARGLTWKYLEEPTRG